jgi:cytochrome b
MNNAEKVMVWDPFVRLFHWTLVAAFTVAYLSAEDWEGVHVIAGYVVLGLVVARILWGFIGTRNARFTSFVRSPTAAGRYALDVLTGRAARHLGHNPAGGLMIVLMIIALVATTLTGLALYGADEGAGPLAFWLAGSGERLEHTLEEVHEFFANLMVAFIVIHVLGVIVESFLHHEDLVGAMFHGRKRV